MSKWKSAEGEDYPEAAEKHLHDSGILLKAGRHDNAAYLLGYVVECFIKTLLLIEGEKPARVHSFEKLSEALRAINTSRGSKTILYRKSLQSLVPEDRPPKGWHPSLRYRPVNTMNPEDAAGWFELVKNKLPPLLKRLKTEGHI